jgi:hypothetical protein
MLSKKQILFWVLDAGLLSGFLLAFFLNLTGLDIHQWLGIFLGGFAFLHLTLHLGWVKTVTTRFFSKTSWRMRLYYLLDASILWGFVSIVLTGIVISSWLSLALSNYGVWRSVHVWASIVTLLMVVVKVGLHWRWIVGTLVKAMTPPIPAARPIGSPALQPVGGERLITRREFLMLMGVVGVGAVLGVTNVLGEKKVQVAEAISNNLEAQGSADQIASNFIAPTTSASTTASTGTASLACTRCPKGRHCAYPGQCGRYTDQNSNGRCDLGECA